jgi:hypothetical protein
MVVTVFGGVTTMAMKTPHPTPCCKLIHKDSVGNNLLKKELLQVVPQKMDRFVTRKLDSEELLKNVCTLIINFSSLF